MCCGLRCELHGRAGARIDPPARSWLKMMMRGPAKTGFLKPKTERARQIIELLDLNRPDLVDERRGTYKACVELLKDYLDTVKIPDPGARADIMEQLAKITKGFAKYSLVGRHALRECKNAFEQLLTAG